MKNLLWIVGVILISASVAVMISGIFSKVEVLGHFMDFRGSIAWPIFVLGLALVIAGSVTMGKPGAEDSIDSEPRTMPAPSLISIRLEDGTVWILKDDLLEELWDQILDGTEIEMKYWETRDRKKRA